MPRRWFLSRGVPQGRGGWLMTSLMSASSDENVITARSKTRLPRCGNTLITETRPSANLNLEYSVIEYCIPAKMSAFALTIEPLNAS